MRYRPNWVICLFFLATPYLARGQTYEVPPSVFTGPLSHPRYESHQPFQTFVRLGEGIERKREVVFHESDDHRCSWFASLIPNAKVGSVGIADDVYLGTTMLGSFSASVDVQTTIASVSSGIAVHWYPWEVVTLSGSIRLGARANFCYDFLHSLASFSVRAAPGER